MADIDCRIITLIQTALMILKDRPVCDENNVAILKLEAAIRVLEQRRDRCVDGRKVIQ